MGIFATALEQGKIAASTAERSNREIENIFDNLKTDVLAFTSQKVHVSLESGASFPAFAVLAASAARKSLGLVADEPSLRVLYITASTHLGENSKAIKLAGFECPFQGYPCTISYSNVTERCNDADALTLALQEMLSDPWVANKIIELERGATAPSKNNGIPKP